MGSARREGSNRIVQIWQNDLEALDKLSMSSGVKIALDRQGWLMAFTKLGQGISGFKLRALQFGAVVLASVLLAPSASAWEYLVQADKFDRSKQELIYTKSDDGISTLAIYAGGGGHINNAGIRIQLIPGDNYICNTSSSDRQFVDWVIVDKSGAEISKEYLTNWEVSTDRSSLYIGDGINRKTGGYESRYLVDTMLSAAEARFRFTDDCGEKTVAIFSLSDFRQAVDKINAPY